MIRGTASHAQLGWLIDGACYCIACSADEPPSQAEQDDGYATPLFAGDEGEWTCGACSEQFNAEDEPADDAIDGPDYAAIGSELEHASADDLLAFTRKFRGTTDGAMAALVAFATFTLSARNARLKGDIQGALMFERNAETVYQRDILPANRW